MRKRRRIRVVRKRNQDGGRGAKVGDALRFDEREDRGRIDFRKAHVGSARCGYRPRIGPAVAVEHGEGPEIDAFRPQVCVEHFAERILVRAAMRVHHALRATGRAARVVDGDDVVFVRHRVRERARIGRFERGLERER